MSSDTFGTTSEWPYLGDEVTSQILEDTGEGQLYPLYLNWAMWILNAVCILKQKDAEKEIWHIILHNNNKKSSTLTLVEYFGFFINIESRLFFDVSPNINLKRKK